MKPKVNVCLLIALIVCLALPMGACGRRNSGSSSSSSSSESTDAPAVEQVQSDQGNTTSKADESVTTDQSAPADQEAPTEEAPAESPYAVTIDSAQVTQDSDGKPAVIVTYTFTNNSDEETSFSSACTTKVFQNGVQCEYAYSVDYDSNAYMKELQPGATYQVQRAYEITDMSPIDVKVEESFSWDDVVLAEKTLTLE